MRADEAADRDADLGADVEGRDVRDHSVSSSEATLELGISSSNATNVTRWERWENLELICLLFEGDAALRYEVRHLV